MKTLIYSSALVLLALLSVPSFPEPPVYMLMSIGLGLLGLGYATMKFRKRY